MSLPPLESRKKRIQSRARGLYSRCNVHVVDFEHFDENSAYGSEMSKLAKDEQTTDVYNNEITRKDYDDLLVHLSVQVP